MKYYYTPEEIAKKLNDLTKQICCGSGGGGGTADFANIPFSQNIPFSNNLSIMEDKIVTAPLTFTPDFTDQFPGAGTLVRIIADGATVPNFNQFRMSTNSSEYYNTNGVLNVFYFFYDGTDYWVNIWQDVNFQVTDIIAPVYVNSTVSSTNTVTVNFDEALANIVPVIGDFILSGKTITNVQIIGSTVVLTVSGLIGNSDVINLSYTPGTNKLQDIAGNLVLPIVAQPVNNNNYTLVNWDILSATTLYEPGVVRSDTGTAGAYQSTVITLSSNFELVRESYLIHDGELLTVDLNISNDYQWPNPQSFLAGMYKYGGDYYIASVSGSMGGNAAGPFPHGDKYIRMKKSGNDLIFARSNDLVTWTDLYTYTGILTGVTQLYFKAIMTGGGYLKAFYKN